MPYYLYYPQPKPYLTEPSMIYAPNDEYVYHTKKVFCPAKKSQICHLPNLYLICVKLPPELPPGPFLLASNWVNFAIRMCP